jgi:transcriptional regulator with XRE-family HTH domain
MYSNNLLLTLISLIAAWLMVTDPRYWSWLLTIINKSLRNARKAHGWTIEDIAWEVGVDTSTYARWERGVQRPHPRNVAELESVFNISAEELELTVETSVWGGSFTKCTRRQPVYCNADIVIDLPSGERSFFEAKRHNDRKHIG